eukprot:SAG31_NODE_1677_length_7533_cov_2.288054_10_plen_93_part_00
MHAALACTWRGVYSLTVLLSHSETVTGDMTKGATLDDAPKTAAGEKEKGFAQGINAKQFVIITPARNLKCQARGFCVMVRLPILSRMHLSVK